jgi:hypothetical protein
MTCQHPIIQTYRGLDNVPVMWACYDCKHKFAPLEIKVPENCGTGHCSCIECFKLVK